MFTRMQLTCSSATVLVPRGTEPAQFRVETNTHIAYACDSCHCPRVAAGLAAVREIAFLARTHVYPADLPTPS